MSIGNWLSENKDAYTDRAKWMSDCAKALKVSRKAVANRATGIWPVRLSPQKPVVPKGSDVMCADEFLSSVDVVARIREYLDATVKDGYIEDERLRKNFEVPQARWREICGLAVFQTRRLTYQVHNTQAKKTVWSSIKGIKALQATLSLSRYDN